MGLADDASDFIGAAIILVIGLYVVAQIVLNLIPTNSLFADMIVGGGVLAAIVAGAKAILERA